VRLQGGGQSCDGVTVPLCAAVGPCPRRLLWGGGVTYLGGRVPRRARIGIPGGGTQQLHVTQHRIKSK